MAERARPARCATCTHTTVQAAIDDSGIPNGATVRICAGTYNESIQISRELNFVGAGQGSGPGDTILHGQTGSTVFVYNGHTITYPVTIQRLRITGGAGTLGGGINNNIGELTMTNCMIGPNNSASSQGGGIWVAHNSSGLTLEDCTLTGNQADSGGGVYLDRSSADLTNGTVTGNTATTDGDDILNLESVLVVNGTTIGECVESGLGACGCPGGTPCGP